MIRGGLLLGILGALLAGAGCRERADADAEAQTAPDSQHLHARAAELGQQISREVFQLLSQNLQAAIQQGGVTNAIPFCSAVALTLTESAGKPYQAQVRRISHRPRNPKAGANDAELAILDQFRVAMQASTNIPPALTTNLQPGAITYFGPIVLNNQLCLQCHGEPGKDIQPATLDVLKQLYPNDQAVGFKMGDLRGAWRLDIPVRVLQSRTDS